MTIANVTEIDFQSVAANQHGSDMQKMALHCAQTMDPNYMRPWYDKKTRRSYVTIFNAGPYADKKDPKNWTLVPIQNHGTTLTKDEWNLIDSQVLQVSRPKLVAIEDLVRYNLVKPISNPMAKTFHQYQRQNGRMKAKVSMDAIAAGENNTRDIDLITTPLPIIHADFFIDTRQLNASRLGIGEALDVSQMREASRAVAEAMENMLSTDTQYKHGGGTIYSYLNAPDKNSVTMTTSWTDPSMTGKDILEDARKMVQAALDKNQMGPFIMYVPRAYSTKLGMDYSDAKGDNTIKERLLKVDDSLKEIKVLNTLPTDTVVLVQLSTDTVRLLDGFDIRTVQWAVEGGMRTKYKVMALRIPEIRSDKNKQSGIVVLSK